VAIDIELASGGLYGLGIDGRPLGEVSPVSASEALHGLEGIQG
jgi:hypothetical protein